MKQDLPRLAVEVEIDEHVLLDFVVVPEVVGIELVGPMRIAAVGVAGEKGCRPEVVAGALIRVPGTGIGGSVVNEIEVRIVGEPAPHGSAADLPGVWRPRADAEVLALHEIIERLEVRPKADVLVRSGGIGDIVDLAGIFVEDRDAAPHAHLAAADADEDFALHH